MDVYKFGDKVMESCFNFEECSVFCGALVSQSSGQGPFTSEILGSNLGSARCTTRYVRRVSQRSAKSRGFSPGIPVSSHLKCWQGWLRIKIDTQPTLPCIVAVLRTEHWVVRRQPVAPSICLPWAASFVLRVLDCSPSCMIRMTTDEHLPTLP